MTHVPGRESTFTPVWRWGKYFPTWHERHIQHAKHEHIIPRCSRIRPVVRVAGCGTAGERGHEGWEKGKRGWEQKFGGGQWEMREWERGRETEKKRVERRQKETPCSLSCKGQTTSWRFLTRVVTVAWKRVCNLFDTKQIDTNGDETRWV